LDFRNESCYAKEVNLPKDRVAIKICGITNETDALAAIKAGADMIGFNTWTGTKRHIDLEEHSSWLSQLPARITKVALTVNASLEEVIRIAALPYIDALQLHGDEDAEFCTRVAALGKPFIRAIRAKDNQSINNAEQWMTPHILIDAHVPGQYGGTGAKVDISFVREFLQRYPDLKLWLAGGLNPDNVYDIVCSIKPSVLDVSSGVELEIGKKSVAKMESFVVNALATQ
jgi:phosphoribosylanthranilate isomerase